MTDTKMNQIADKVQKLLALAGNNPSAEEAQAALLKAQALIAKYNLDMDKVEGKPEYRYEFIVTKVKSHTYNNSLGSIIAGSFACKVIIDGTTNRIGIFGREDNAKAAASALEYAFKVMSRGGNKATRDNGLQPGHTGAAHYYNAYVLGFLKGLKSAMDAQTVALAIVVPEDVNKAFHDKFQTISYTRRGKTKAAYDRNSYNAGMRDGSTCMGKRSLEA